MDHREMDIFQGIQNDQRFPAGSGICQQLPHTRYKSIKNQSTKLRHVQDHDLNMGGGEAATCVL